MWQTFIISLMAYVGQLPFISFISNITFISNMQYTEREIIYEYHKKVADYMRKTSYGTCRRYASLYAC